jgi:GNAT superfamily N-acetyltransferase
MELIAADLNHIQELLDLMHEFYIWGDLPWKPDAARGALTALLEDDRLGQAWLTQEDGKRIGYMVFTYGYSLEFGGMEACLDELFILEEYRGRGFGSQTIQSIFPLIKAQGVRVLGLEVDFDDLRAQKFYRSLGFQRRDGYHTMVLQLDSQTEMIN